MRNSGSGRLVRLSAPLLATLALAIACFAAPSSAQSGGPAPGARATSGSGLAAFRSDAELRKYLRQLRQQQKAEEEAMVPEPVMSPPSPVAPSEAPSSAASDVATTGSRIANPSITNTQEANVDEGGIVKVSGETLVILRRGRLFTVSLAGGGMRPINSIDAFPPGVSGRGDWYDEMLLSGDRIVVVGYSYARGGTEINRFRVDPNGRLRFEDAYHLRSNDYYSSRNYASRLIGNRLIFYTPLYLDWRNDPLEALPGIRRWQGNKANRSFQRIASARQVYIAPIFRDAPEARIDTLHSVTTCDLTAPVLDCSATAVIGPGSRTFYVSGQAVYLWISNAWSDVSRRRRAQAFVFRLPLGRQRPSAIAARGAPVDQFSFREDAADGMLNVLVRADGGGDAMWRPEVSTGDAALLRLPLREFGDGSREARRAFYRPLPKLAQESWSFHNRFVGGYLLYGGGSFGARPPGANLFVVPLRGGTIAELEVPHAVDRIEALGRDAMVVGGSPRGLGFTSVDLGGGAVAGLGDTYIHPDSAEGETRSHAFFFRPDLATPDGASGLVGLPVARAVEPDYRRFLGSGAAMVFLRREDRRLSPAGELAARVEGVTDDDCQASCVDWYGNARPIFLGSRTFALLGYELVEGEFARAKIREVARVSFAPGSRPAKR